MQDIFAIYNSHCCSSLGMIRSDDFSGVIAIDINNFPEDFLVTSEQINQQEKHFWRSLVTSHFLKTTLGTDLHAEEIKTFKS